MEILSGGLLGSVLGGIFRLVPEVLKFFDRVNERKHELGMFKLQTDLEKLKGEFRVEEKYVDYSVSQMDAIGKAMKQQGEADSRAYKWVASLSALVRPTITYVIFGMYVAYKCILINYAIASGATWHHIFVTMWTPEDFAMLNMILTFWFVGRAIEKYRRT